MLHRIRNSRLALAVLVLLAAPLLAQVQVGDNLKLNLNGTVSLGYNDTYGNAINSSHGVGFGGTAGLSGSYYNPNFLSFNVNPYFNQSRVQFQLRVRHRRQRRDPLVGHLQRQPVSRFRQLYDGLQYHRKLWRTGHLSIRYQR